MSTFPVLLNPAPVPARKPGRVEWIPMVLGVVFVACTSNAFMGGAHSQAVIGAVWQGLLGRWHFEEVGTVNLLARKIGHFLGHGVLALVFRNTWYTVLRRWVPDRANEWLSGAAFLAVMTTLAIASLDEMHQMFVPGRVGCVRDVMIDTAGSFVANLLFVSVKMHRRSYAAFPGGAKALAAF